MSTKDTRLAEAGVVEPCSLGGDDEEEPGKVEAFEDGDGREESFLDAAVEEERRRDQVLHTK